MSRNLQAPLEIEGRSFLDWILHIVLMVFCGYFLLIFSYAVAIIIIFKVKTADVPTYYSPPLPVLAEGVFASNLRSTFPAFLKNFHSSDATIIRDLKSYMRGFNFLPVHVLLNVLAFSILGSMGARLGLYSSTLILPVLLFVSTFGLMRAEILDISPNDIWGILFVFVVQCFSIYGTGLVLKWDRMS